MSTEQERPSWMSDELASRFRGLNAMPLFLKRGLSNRTIYALVEGGIDMPERLLFATEAELKKIPGIGKASFDEIMKYRANFLPRSE